MVKAFSPLNLIEIQRTPSSVERFSGNTPSVQGISCTYGVSPSPSKVPSPKRSRLRTNPSQDFMLLRATQSDSSVASLSSDKASDLKPKVSAAWLDDVMVGGGDASVRSQSPKRPYSSPTPSLRKRSSGRLSFRYSLDGVSVQKDNVIEKPISWLMLKCFTCRDVILFCIRHLPLSNLYSHTELVLFSSQTQFSIFPCLFLLIF